MLELHQDLYSRAAAGFAGRGAPDWATITDGVRIPTRQRLVWAEGYFWGCGVHRAFDHFWANTEVYGRGLQDHYAAMWAMMAQRWGDHPAMLGYDFMNEPFPGTEGGRVFRSLITRIPLVALRHPIRTARIALAALRGERLQLLNELDRDVMRSITRTADERIQRFDVEQYTPFFAKMTQAVREVTPHGIVFMEHSYWSNLGIPFHATAPEGEVNVAYSPHGYDLVVDTEFYHNPSTDRVLAIFEEVRRAQQRLNVPVLVGEWGGEFSGRRFIEHCEELFDLFDSFGWSSAYYAWWRWGWFELAGMDFLARPYPMAVNGREISYRYDRIAMTWTLEFTIHEDMDSLLPTIIYLPFDGAIEAEGFDIEIVPIGHERSMPDSRYVYLTGGQAGQHRVFVTF